MVSPDGTVIADRIIEDATAGNTHFISQSITYTNVIHTFSCFAKAGERTWIMLNTFDGTTSRSCYFNLGTGAVGTANAATGTIESWGNGWYRCSVTTAVATAAAVGNAAILLATGDGGQSYDGNGVSGVYVWGAQLEAFEFASSYIPTTAGTVTRNADVLTYSSSGNANDSSGTLYAEFRTATTEGNQDQAILEINDGTVVITSNTNYKTAYGYELNNIRACANGTFSVADNVGTTPTMTTISIGSRNGGSLLYSSVKNVRIWSRRLQDNYLSQLTT
jgi:hypothetical protein